MITVNEMDKIPLEDALADKGLTDLAVWGVSGSGVVTISLPSFNDEQDVIGELDYHGIGFSYTH